MSGSYRGSGSASYHPRLLLGILVYGYATGVFSSRKLERATYDSVAFRFIAANDHPDHDTIAAFRRRFLKEIEALFVQVLLLAREMGVLKMGTIALDGTKIHANASRHSALSYEHAGKIEAQLQAEVADLMAKAEAADTADIPDGMSIPDELARREERLRKIAEARTKIEARAKERYARELAEHEAKLAARAAKTAATGKKPGGKPPRASDRGTAAAAIRSISPTKSRASCRWPAAASSSATMRRPPWRREACWWSRSMWFRRPTTSSSSSRCWARSSALPEELGEAETLLADTGYFSAGNVKACEKAGVEPLIAMGRQPHHPPLEERFEPTPPAPENPTPVEGDGASAEDAGRQRTICSAQTDPGTGVRHHQIGARIPSIFDARTRKSAWRVEPRDHGLEYEADVRPQPRLTSAAQLGRSSRRPDARSIGAHHNAFWTRSSVK